MRLIHRILFLALALLAGPGAAQGQALTLELESADGPITLTVGSRLSRDSATDTLVFEGGVQLLREPDLLIIADQASLDLEGNSGGIGTLGGNFDALRLSGQIYARLSDTEIQGDEILVSQSSESFLATGSPLIFQAGEQRLQTSGQIEGVLSTRTFTATGGVTAEVEGALVQAETIEITLPEAGDIEAIPAIKASGAVYLRVEEAEVWAGQIRSDETGTWFYFSGGVTVISPDSQIRAETAWFNRQTQAFSLGQVPPSGG